MSNAPTPASEHDAIAGTIQKYIDGGISGKGDDMRPAFHADATIFGYIGPDLFGGPIQLLFDWNDQNGPAEGLQARKKVAVVGRGHLAQMRVAIEEARQYGRIGQINYVRSGWYR